MVDSIPCSDYAISVLDDENESLSMDYNALGIPKEDGASAITVFKIEGTSF